MFAQQPLNQNFNLAAGCLLPMQASGQHPGIVKYQQILGLQHAHNVAEHVVGNSAAVAIKTQHATATAIGRRVVSDQLVRQLIIKVG